MPDTTTKTSENGRRTFFYVAGPRWADGRPMWRVRALLMPDVGPAGARAAFVHDRPGNDRGQASLDATLLPGTMRVRVEVREVELRFGDDRVHEIKYPDDLVVQADLLVAVPATAWEPTLGTRVRIDGDASVACVAGEIPLDRLLTKKLKGFVAAALARTFDGPVTNLSLTSSGLILDGRPIIPPGAEARLAGRAVGPASAGPFLVEVPKPSDPPGAWLVRVDPERLTAPTFAGFAAQLRALWTGLVARLNPLDTTGQAAPGTRALRWASLELADPGRLPEFFFRIAPPLARPTSVLRFVPGEWRLTLADQTPGLPAAAPRGTLSAKPDVELTADALIAWAGDADPSRDFEPDDPLAIYSAEISTSANLPEWTESIRLTRVRMGYDAVEVAARLRRAYGLPAPKADDVDAPGDGLSSDAVAPDAATDAFSDGKIDPPVLWGFTPLEDGWAQLPFLNLTEHLYVDALPSPNAPVASDATEVTSFWRGAAVFGSDRTETFRRDDGVVPWNVAILDSDGFRGTWALPTATDGPVTRVTLHLLRPEATAEGLLWLATTGPTAHDALPTLDDWLGGLAQVPLRTFPTPDTPDTDPYPCPFAVAVNDLGFAREPDPSRAASPFVRPRLDTFEWAYVPNTWRTHRGGVRPAELDAEVPFVSAEFDAGQVTEQQVRDSGLADRLSIVPGGTAGVRRLRWERAFSAPPTPDQRERLAKLRDPKVKALADFVDTCLALPGGPAAAATDVTAPLLGWLTAFARSRFPYQRVWGVDAPTAEPTQPGLAWRRHPTHPCVQALPLTQSATPPNYPGLSRQLAPFDLPLRALTFRVDTAEARVSVRDFATLVPDDWTFRAVSSPPNAARPGARQSVVTWPVVASVGSGDPLRPAAVWARLDNLPLVPLGIPGIEVAPGNPPAAPLGDPSGFLGRFDYRHDLPVLDQLNALAELPSDDPRQAARDARPGAGAGETGGPDRGATAPVLGRGDYARHWRTLADRALLAQADAVRALAPDPAEPAAAVRVAGLMEPREWRARPALSLDRFPGALTLTDAAATGNGQAPPAVTLAGDASDALRGIDGGFEPRGADELVLVGTQGADGARPVAPVQVVGGAMAALVEGAGATRRLRDQRGLRRAGAAAGPSGLILTAVDLDGAADGARELCTLRRAATLSLPGGGAWHLWVKDLPVVRAGSALTFDRSALGSPTRAGVNDPAASGRALNHLTGYEWRLGGATATGGYPVGPLVFHPLSLEHASFDPATGAAARVEILGRLQLPVETPQPTPALLAAIAAAVITPAAGIAVPAAAVGDAAAAPPPDPELTTVDAAVVIAFVDGRLESVRRAPEALDDGQAGSPGARPPARWPLTDAAGAATAGAPAVLWDDVRAEPDVDPDRLALNNPRLSYSRHGVVWDVPLDALSIPLSAGGPAVTAAPRDPAAASDAGPEVEITTVRLSLFVDGWGGGRLTPVRHAAEVTWAFRWGAADALRLVVGYVDRLLGPGRPDDLTARLVHRDVGIPVVPAGRPHLDARAVALTWTGLGTPANATREDLQVLPGMHVAPATPDDDGCDGYALMSFDLGAPDPAQVAGRSLAVRGAYLDVVLACRWGDALQDAFAARPATADVTAAAFNSSAGALLAEYTCDWVPADPDTFTPACWRPDLALSGVIEVKNLVSWPAGLEARPDGTVVLPPAADERRLDHYRHTARVLLAEHRPPPRTLVAGDGPHCFLRLDDKAAWTFPATVEHQLLKVAVARRDTAAKPDPARPTDSDGDRAAAAARGSAVTATADPADDVRWTAVQQVHFCAPEFLFHHVRETAGRRTVEGGYAGLGVGHYEWMTGQLGAVALGMYSAAFLAAAGVSLDARANTLADFERSAFGRLGCDPGERRDAIIVEASAPLFLRRAATPGEPATPLASVPGGAVDARLATLDDFGPAADPDAPGGWLFAVVPFVGRLQHRAADSADGAARVAGPSFAVDPVLQVAGTPLGASPDKLPLAMSNWGDRKPVRLAGDPFDARAACTFRRLDASSLTESWYRLTGIRDAAARRATPDPRRPLPGALAAAPSDAAAVLARPPGLWRLFDPARPFLPAAQTGRPRLTLLPRDEADRLGEGFVWTPESLLLVQAAIARSVTPAEPYAFAAWPLAVTGAEFVRPSTAPPKGDAGAAPPPRRHPAATLIPAGRRSDPQPVAVAVPPFVALGVRGWPVDATATPLIAAGELVAFDAGRRRALIVAAQASTPDPDQAAAQTQDAFDRALADWGAGAHARLAADSPVSAVRIRTVRAIANNGTPVPVGVDVRARFRLPSAFPAQAAAIVTRSSALQPPPQGIRCREGQFRGPAVPPPRDAADFELASPLVDGAQPVRLDARPKPLPDYVQPAGTGGANQLLDLKGWPWGLSGIRLSTAYRRRAPTDAQDASTAPLLGTAGPALFAGPGSSQPSAARTVWWQGLSAAVQSFVPAPADRRLLPAAFRAPALPAFFPTWPAMPLPGPAALARSFVEIDADASADADVDVDGDLRGQRPWQPVLPGGRDTVLTALRPGVSFAFRETLITQRVPVDPRGAPVATGDPTRPADPGDVHTSGSVPVQHRFPRPVRLPDNRHGRQETALVPWGSWFDLVPAAPDGTGYRTLRAADRPGGTLMLLAPDAAAVVAVGLELVLRPPTGDEIASITDEPQRNAAADRAPRALAETEIPPGWDGTVALIATVPAGAHDQTAGANGIDSWTFTLTLTDGIGALPFTPADAHPMGPRTWVLWFKPATGAALAERVSAYRHGEPVTLRLAAGLRAGQLPPRDGGAALGYRIDGYRQTLNLGLRAIASQVPSVFAPTYLSFEDPEYNRALASLAARTTAVVLTRPATGDPVERTFVLAADRREYNTAGPIHYVFYRDPLADPAYAGKLEVYRVIDTSGVAIPLRTVNPAAGVLPAIDLTENTLPIEEGALDLVGLCGTRLEVGDVLRLRLILAGPEIDPSVRPTVDLDLRIVAEPVTPTPGAAYAVIRGPVDAGLDAPDECVRFAWGPAPSGVELVDPDDLTQEVVRRRAVFAWTDTVRRRPGAARAYVVQKTTATGSTHFPKLR